MIRSVLTGIILLLVAHTLRAQGVWLTDSSTLFLPRYHFVAGSIAGKIYVFGGLEDRGMPIQAFDPVQHQWSDPEFNLSDSSYGEALCVAGDTMYLIGGVGLHGLDSEITFVVPISGLIDHPAATGHYTPRLYPSCALVGRKIYLFGGEQDSIDTTIQVFDLDHYTWSTLNVTGTYAPVYGGTATAVGDKVYLIGGITPAFERSSVVQIFDPATNTVSAVGTTGSFTARGFHVAGLIDGKIYVAGGGNQAFPLEWSMSPDTTELQMFDPDTKAWSTLTANGQFTSRLGLASVVLDGKLYALGGYRPHQPINTVEVYTPGSLGVASVHTGASVLRLAPDPATDRITISNLNSMTQSQLEVFDALGRCVLVESIPSGQVEHLVDIGHLVAGPFEVHVGETRGRFIKL